MINAQTLARLKAIPNAEWELIYKELVLYATFKLEDLEFVIRTEQDVMLAEDLAQEAIARVFEGTRAWNAQKYPDLLIHLKLIVKSLISNQMKKSSKAVVTQERVAEVNDDNEDTPADEPVETENPESLLIDQEFWQKVERNFAGSDEEFLIFSEWFEMVPPRQIAQDYGRTPMEIYRIVKKGKKIVSSIVKGE